MTADEAKDEDARAARDDEATRERSEANAAGGHLAPLLPFLRRAAGDRRDVTYAEAEALARRLAVRLRQAYSRDELEAAEWRAIPRGGLLALGMLAYHLDLPQESLSSTPPPPFSPDRLLVLVDDCALSGLRLREHLEALGEEPDGEDRSVVVAHLLSTPALRRAVEEREPQVVACLAGGDLEDRTAERGPRPEQRPEWQRLWSERLGGDERYWLGLPRLVSFPWSEPDRPFWNAERQRMEDGWRFVPPHRCLKSRGELARELPPGPDAGSRWHLAENVAWGDFDEVLWLCHLESEAVFSLAGSGRTAWRALVTGRGSGGAAAVLASVYAVDPRQAQEDVDALVEELAAQGLLVADAGELEPAAEEERS